MKRINVTQTFLPSFEEYTAILRKAWESKWITNNGQLCQELEKKLSESLGIPHLLFTGNGTIVLQMALKALGITREVITTPFSYVATTNAILWEGCTPVFADIRQDDFCIDVNRIEPLINENTQAILATHVYGLPCDVEGIEKLALKYNLKVIYDGAHAFGCHWKGKSLLAFGDISTCSFHATKLFHTVEGGCITTNDAKIFEHLKLMRSFGHYGDDYYEIGVNGKNSEFHAAMGLAVFPYVNELISLRRERSSLYGRLLENASLVFPFINEELTYNYAYYPVVFPTEADMLRVKVELEKSAIYTRRYFYPSLNELPFLDHKQVAPISEDISRRVLCLPLYPDLDLEDIHRICEIIAQTPHE